MYFYILILNNGLVGCTAGTNLNQPPKKKQSQGYKWNKMRPGPPLRMVLFGNGPACTCEAQKEGNSAIETPQNSPQICSEKQFFIQSPPSRSVSSYGDGKPTVKISPLKKHLSMKLSRDMLTCYCWLEATAQFSKAIKDMIIHKWIYIQTIWTCLMLIVK